MKFDVAGPFELTRHGNNKIINRQSQIDLRTLLGTGKHKGLAEACGCYVFAVQTGGGSKPYYVGQACKSSLLREALNPANREKYNTVLGRMKRGTPVLFFLPMKTPKGKFKKTKKAEGKFPSLTFLERWLIATALEKNPRLANNKETKFLRTIHVHGIFNAKKGEATKSSRALDSVLW